MGAPSRFPPMLTRVRAELTGFTFANPGRGVKGKAVLTRVPMILCGNWPLFCRFRRICEALQIALNRSKHSLAN